MVEQNAKKYGLRFKARVQLDLYLTLFRQRLEGRKLYINKAMEAQFAHNPETAEEREIRDLILEWHSRQIPLLEEELFKQKKRLSDAIRSLEGKATKKAENDKRIASNKIEKLKSDLARHSTQEVTSESEERIYPLHYITMLCLDEDGNRVVRPVRYLMRAHNKDERFDSQFNGCYNARLDGLESVPWWKDSFGKRHGVILVKKFFENVDAKDYAKKHPLPSGSSESDKMVLCFQPDNVEYMLIPTLWDIWKEEGEPKLYSAALITDDPAPEIADAGHDRTPIFLKESAVDDWLSVKGGDIEHFRSTLRERETPYYSHRILRAA
jgi:putative SOS response-associated peptidase YedK